MAHTMRAILLAKATAASLRGLRLSRFSSLRGGWPPRLGMLDYRGRPQHQQLPQPLIASPTDAAQRLFARGRAFPRNQPEPGGEVARRCELPRIDPQRKIQRPDRPNLRDRSQPPAHRIGLVLLP